MLSGEGQHHLASAAVAVCKGIECLLEVLCLEHMRGDLIDLFQVVRQDLDHLGELLVLMTGPQNGQFLCIDLLEVHGDWLLAKGHSHQTACGRKLAGCMCQQCGNACGLKDHVDTLAVGQFVDERIQIFLHRVDAVICAKVLCHGKAAFVRLRHDHGSAVRFCNVGNDQADGAAAVHQHHIAGAHIAAPVCLQANRERLAQSSLLISHLGSISSEKKIESAIHIVANENRYHPIRDYLNGLKWDGTERIAHVLHHFLGAAEDEYTCEATKIFLLGAIKRIFQPGCKFETMLCLVGGQGAGKSAFFRLLAVKDEWFSDDLRRLDDDNVYRKLQGHWIIEMSEMIATDNAKSIEEIKSFLSKQKETYKIPYETHPADRLRQCVFAGTTNRQDFLPRDRTGNRRFIPVPVDAELAEVHILDDETESRTYIDQLWAEAMILYNSGNYKLAFSPAMQETLQAHQQDFMQEDAQAGMIYAFLEDYTGNRVCSKQLYAEALGNTNIPAEWETRAICEIINTGISRGDIQGWQAHKTAKRYPKYGVQKGWERVTSPETGAEDFSEITDAEAKQLGFPF